MAEAGKPTLGPGIIPQSNALAEALPDSIAEFLSRDPEGYTRQDRDRMVVIMREQRVRWEAAEAAEPKKRTSAGPKAQLASSTAAKADDLGL